MVDKKNPASPTEVEGEQQEAPREVVYDISADATAETDPAVEDLDAAVPGGEDAAAESAAEPGRKKRGGKFSRREVLDRFQQKNDAIAQLSKEKAALEKERASFAAARAALEAQVSELKDRWLRSAAEFENYRKRSAREWELLKQQSKTEVILEFLSSLDDFERAFAVVGDQAESEFVRGIRLIYNNLLQAFQKMDVAEVEALHQPFDPKRHMAVGQVETTEVASGHVVEVAQKGYAMNGNVIRPARVIVAK